MGTIPQPTRRSKEIGVNRRILQLAVPAVVSNVTVPLLSLCDTAVTGHLGSPLYLAAIASGTMMVNVCFWLFGFLRMATAGLTANAFGAGNDRMIATVFSRSLLLGLLAGVILALCVMPLRSLLLTVVAPSAEVGILAGRYFTICLMGAPPLLATIAITGWFIGMQNTFWPMAVAITVNVINIGCSLLAVYVFNLGFEGVAWGTLTANWCGLVLSLCAALWMGRGRKLWCGWRELVKAGGKARFLNVSLDLMLRSACIMTVSLGVTAIGARIGDMTLAVNAVLMQFFVFFSYFMDGLAFAGEALCGRYCGAGDLATFRRATRGMLWWSVILALLFLTLYALGGDQVASLITNEKSVLTGVSEMHGVLILIPPVSVAAFIFDGFYIGLAATRRMLLTTVAALAAFYIVALAIPSPLSNTWLWAGFLSYLAVRGFGLAIQFPATVNSRFPHPIPNQ